MPTVRIQVIKVYDIDLPDGQDPIGRVYQMQSTDIADQGKLVDVSTDHAEIV